MLSTKGLTVCHAVQISNYLIRKKEVLNDMGLGDQITITQDVAIFIMANPGILTEELIKLDYFSRLGRSTIKRAVHYLFINGFVKKTVSSVDRRRRELYFKDVD